MFSLHLGFPSGWIAQRQKNIKSFKEGYYKKQWEAGD